MNTPFIYQPPQEPLKILYEDEHFIVIDKPSGLLSVMGRLAEHQDSAYWRILQQYPFAKVVHRLDMATSGILLFAKHRDAEVMMSKLFQARHVSKYYTAQVQGKLLHNGTVDVPLIADWEQRPRQKVDFEHGKSALTHYEIIAYDAKRDETRVKLIPITGRSHQLRVHMAHLGHPIMGDKLYHPEPSLNQWQRLALHATALEFTCQITLKHIKIESVVPF